MGFAVQDWYELLERSRVSSPVSRGGIDDWDKLPSFDAGEAPRRSISYLSFRRYSRPCRHIWTQLRSKAAHFSLVRLRGAS